MEIGDRIYLTDRVIKTFIGIRDETREYLKGVHIIDYIDEDEFIIKSPDGNLRFSEDDIQRYDLSDPVNSPSHYTSGSIECIDAIQASMSDEAFKGFLKANCMKYLWRMEKKENPKQDLEKAKWYLDKLISLM